MFYLPCEKEDAEEFCRLFRNKFKEEKPCETLMGDKGSIFTSDYLKEFMSTNYNIDVKIKSGGYYNGIGGLDGLIHKVRSRVYRFLHGYNMGVQEFLNVLFSVIHQSNTTPRKYLANLSPTEVHSGNSNITQAVLLHQYKTGYLKRPFTIPSLLKINAKNKYYNELRPTDTPLESSGFFRGDLVYLDHRAWTYKIGPKRTKDKRFEGPFIIDLVQTNIDAPTYYKLRRQNGEIVHGRYMGYQLHLVKKYNYGPRTTRKAITNKF